MIAIGTFLIALLVSYLGTRVLLRIRLKRAFVDVPNARSSHESPKPRYGGIAIASGTFAAMGLLSLAIPQARAFWPFAVGGCAVFATGLIDDARGLPAWFRLLVQIGAAFVLVATGHVIERVAVPMGGEVQFGWLSVPITVLFVIGSINAYNFIDGIDGLAAGSAFIACVFLSLAAWLMGHATLALLFLAVAGASLGFLQYNFPPSRLFMGDGGSTFLGYFFAYAAIAGNRLEPALPAFIPVLVLSSLYLDAGLTVVKRLLKRERLFQPHRTHYYQRLLQIGLNHKQVTLVEYLITILLGVSALVYLEAGAWFAPLMTAAWVVLFTLGILKIRAMERGDRMFWERRLVFLIVTDMAAIVAAYLGAYFLRMNFQFTEAEGMAVLRALPIVLVVRSACFFKFGLYRSMWRYTSVADVVRVIKAVTAGSAIVLAAVVLLYRFVAFPRALFLIEYFLLIVLILGVRFSARLFHEIGREPQGASARRYAVIGAGDTAERVARDIKASGPARAVVCFLDDDPARIGLWLHGVPVEGPAERLGEACTRHRVDALAYGLSGNDDASAERWLAFARHAGLVIERLPGAAGAREPASLALDRVARRYRRSVIETSPRSQSALRGARVLVTHGGERIGGALIARLRAVGAVPVLHVDDPRTVSEGALRDVVHYAGPLPVAAADAIATARPDVVVHAVSVEPTGAENEDERAWHHVVRESDLLARELWTQRPGSRLVVAAFWGGARPGDRAAAVAAAMEAAVLNRAGAEPVSVVRLPRILTAALLADASWTKESSNARFDALESEAAALLTEIAGGAFRGIYTLAPSSPIDWEEARRAAARGDEERGRDSLHAHSAPRSGLVFPSEHLDLCGIDGVRRVLSPLFPAADPFRKLATHGPASATRAEREDWTRAVTAQLYHVGRAPETTPRSDT
jgi:UDP-GlcNAc:undecaprenyl-phosphate GlcNAc-1-phosphate transferase